MTKLRHTSPQDDHERQIVAEVGRAQRSLEAALSVCQRRATVRDDNGNAQRQRYKDTARSLEALLNGIRSIRGFNAMSQADQPPPKPKVKEDHADAKR